jgi:iron complex outermembrane receptor protein
MSKTTRRAACGLTLPLIAMATSAALARADDAPDQQVTVTAPVAPAEVELTQVNPESSSPQSTVTRQAIEQVAPPAADFGTLANYTPSFVSSAPNGNGFDAAKNMTLRGFADGQFNVTIDGIPYADPDGFSHHSTSFLPSASIEQLLIDRSPGNGTSIGYATIGGSVNIASLALPSAAARHVYGSIGSFNTHVLGARLNAAAPTEDGSTGWMINAEHLQTNGALSHADGRKDDVLLKSETRLGRLGAFGSAKLTLLYTYDDYHFNNPNNVTTAEIAQYGPGFGFNDTPGTANYAGYADTHRTGDFGYAKLEAGLAAAWHVVDTLYTYAYHNNGLSIKGDDTSSPVGNGYGVDPADIAGRISDDRYRTFGNILKFDHADAHGRFEGGLWLDHSRQTYYRNALDLTTGQPYDINKTAGSPVLFDYTSTIDTVEPFANYALQFTDRLIVEPGLRWQQVRRGFDASVVPNSLPGTDGVVKRTVTSLLPSLDANYAFTPQTHGYVQWSNGALVPNQSFFYTKNPAQGNQAEPEASRAVQVGLTQATDHASVTADAYVVHLRNYVSTVTVAGNTEYINDGDVRYRGVEVEGHADLGAGFSGLMNASRIQAQFQTAGVTSSVQQAGDTIPLAPTYVGLVGLLYQRSVWSGSLLTKFVGGEYQGKNGSADGVNYYVPGYKYTNLTVARTLGDWTGLHNARLSLQVVNLLNKTPVTDSAGPSAAGPLEVNVLAPRSFTLAFRTDL